MANNCLVTKLKGTVENPNLFKLGEIVLEGVYQDYTTSAVSQILGVGGVSISPHGDTEYLLDENGEQTQKIDDPCRFRLWAPGEDYPCNVCISNYYGVTYIRYIRGFSPKWCKYMSQLTEIFVYIDGSHVDELLDLPTSLTSLKLGKLDETIGYNEETFLNAVKRLNNLLELQLEVKENLPSVGTLDHLGGCINPAFNRLALLDGMFPGDFVDFVHTARDNGMTEHNQISLLFYGYDYYFNENQLSGGNHSISWTANTITFDDVTINA
jgi:hypothetical protein